MQNTQQSRTEGRLSSVVDIEVIRRDERRLLIHLTHLGVQLQFRCGPSEAARFALFAARTPAAPTVLIDNQAGPHLPLLPADPAWS